jgi:hypothetical protein
MKKFLTGSGLAAVVSALALAPGAGASTGPANTLDGCAVGGPEGTSCTWTADVQGDYAVIGNGGYTVSEQVCSIDPLTGAQVKSWSPIAGDSGSGPAAGSPGSITPGTDGCGNPEEYQLSVTGNEGGALGSVTGQPGAA